MVVEPETVVSWIVPKLGFEGIVPQAVPESTALKDVQFHVQLMSEF